MKDKVKLLRISTVPHSLHLLLRGQIKYMACHNFEVYMASATDNSVSTLEMNEGVPHFQIPLNRKLNVFKDIVALYYTIKLIRKLKPDIVHTHSPKAGIVGMLAAMLCNVKLKIHTVAGLPLVEETGLKRQLLICVEKLTYIFADWVLPNSQEQLQFIKANIDSSDKITIIGKGSSNGIDLDYFSKSENNLTENDNLRKLYNINSDDVVLTFVGRLANYKGCNELVACFKNLSLRHTNIKLFLVGPLEDLNPLMPETLNEIKSNNAIIATGHQNDIRPYLNMADIFVFPSYREGFPQSLMQACAFGLPCIATDINGCNEIVFDDVNGYLIPTKSEIKLIEKCEILINDKNKRLEFGAKGRKYLEDNFEQKQFWHRLKGFYLKKLSL
ncbi:glycosyltransferase family 4 protein [Mucilaginibacter sp. RB4R14]|uniref:glycosyltransferase family 4 protein n=1 Tax=Mucilaginibacter aurantiaciroseus TaxID=2949308 RepID=UPI0020901591|nr:glycosyltransferase family 4 protein [Mucilaginibacter aurantiaciroseus]MCO5935991.1 glycosyltransferase family 4 protein [Mucilaginibacter aurantiaciroseus]